MKGVHCFVEHRGVEPRLAALGQLRNSRPLLAGASYGLLCSAGFRLVSACGGQPTGLPLGSAPLQCFALYSARADSSIYSGQNK